MRDIGILDVKDLNTGNTIKFGDKTLLKYQLIESDGEIKDLSGREVDVVFIDEIFKGKTIVHKTYVQENNYVYFTIDKAIKPNRYIVEFVVSDSFIYPSENKLVIRISKSSKSIDALLIESENIDDLKREITENVIKKISNFNVIEFPEPRYEWVIIHDLNKYPSVSIVDDKNNIVFARIQYVSKEKVKVYFSEPVSGKAYIN